MLNKAKPNEIRIVRLYDAPVKSVWEAWTDPSQTMLWWGPRGFTLTSHSKEFRAFVEERAGMTLGWTGSLDKLEEYISRQN